MNKINLRQKPRVSYCEYEEPNIDEYVYCDKCVDYVYEYCSIHGPLLVIPDDKVPAKTGFPAFVPRAALTIPSEFLHLAPSIIPGAGLGVFTTLTLPRGVRFGPYRGQITKKVDSMYCWQLHDGNNKWSHAIDAVDPGTSNWMRYVNCARHFWEQNLVAYQYQGQIYYRTIKIIPRFTELMVFYGGEFAQLLGINLGLYNEPSGFVQLRCVLIPTSGNEAAAPELKENLEKKSIPEKSARKKTTSLKNSESLSRNNHEIHKDKNACKKKDEVSLNVPKNNSKKKLCNVDNTNGYVNTYTKSTKDLTNNSTDKPIAPINIANFICDVCNSKFDFKNKLIYHMKAHELDRATNSDKTLRQGINVSKNEFICNNNCDSGFNKVSRLPTKTDNINKKPYKCDICHKRFTQTRGLNYHMLIHSGLKPYKCDICNKAFNLNCTLNTHMRIHSGLIPYKCDICNKAFSQSNNLFRHKRIHSGLKPYKCDICNKAFSQPNDLFRHKRIHSGLKPYKCDICNKAFSQSNDLFRHKRIHSGLKPYKCDICNKAFNWNGNLNTHMRIHSGLKPYKCDICNKAFNHNCTLNTHMRIHSGLKPYKCDICNKAFNQNSTLNTHMRIHSGLKPYKCDICNKAFNHNGHLNTHMRIHSGLKPYKCDICKKAFSHNCNLNTHMRIHSGLKPYKCDICNKAFNHNSHLNTHMRIHSGLKPYKCDICNKAFNQNSTLNTHMRIHSGLKPYKCDICNKAFNRNSTLNTHIRIHSGLKPYKCDICNKAFNQNSTLNTHMRIHSGLKP